MPLSGPSVFIVGRVTASRVESFMLIGRDCAFMTPRRKVSIPGALPKEVDLEYWRSRNTAKIARMGFLYYVYIRYTRTGIYPALQ